MTLEKYSSGRRGAPAKGIGRETGARVQIPLSPPLKNSWQCIYIGLVVQLVRMPPCHGGGRGFEPRPDRQYKSKVIHMDNLFCLIK